MSGPRFLIWIALLFVALRLVRTVIAARIFLTSALRAVEFAPVPDAAVPSDVAAALTLLDADLAALGFRPRGYIVHDAVLTYHAEPDYQRLFWQSVDDVDAAVTRRAAPEYGASLNVQLVTRLRDGRQMITTDLGMVVPLAGLDVETRPGSTLAQLYARHMERRGALDPAQLLTGPHELQTIADAQAVTVQALRRDYRLRGWTSPSQDPRLDRITLRGALYMVSRSTRAFGSKGLALAAPGQPSEQNQHWRTELDFQAVKRVAKVPQQAPGVPWPLLSLIALTAVASVVGMTLLWDFRVAVLLFIVLLVHEAGHALVMRMVGHNAVHVFFVPFLGALTIGRPADASVRQRLAVILAGPVPGLVISIGLLSAYRVSHQPLWQQAALMFLFINALNLVPIVPFDGGRYLETLTRPDGVTRVALTLASALLMALGAWYLRDPVITGLAFLSLLVVPQQWRAFQFRRALGRRISDPTNWMGIVRTALEVMTQPRFAQWRSPLRQLGARTAADQFVAARATAADRFVGILGYVVSIGVALAAWSIWTAMRR